MPDDGIGPLGSGIVGGDDHPVGQRAGNRAHNGALGAVPVASAAEQADEPPLGKAPHRCQDVFQRVRGVGIVNEHRIGRGHRDNLHPALHAAGVPQRGGHVAKAQAQRPGSRQHAQGVVDGKASGNGQPNPGNLLQSHGLKLHIGGKQTDIFGYHVGRVLVFRIGHPGAGHGLRVIAPGLVVQIQHGGAALRKQQPLGPPVFLHGMVKIQMVLGEICEDAYGKGDARHSAEDQRVGGNLHHRVGAAGVRHPGQQLLQLVGLRSRAVSRESVRADHVLIGADQPHFGPQAMLQYGLEQISGGGFSVGARHPQDGEPAGRVVKPVCREEGQGGAGVLGNQPGPRLLRRSAAHHRGGALFQRLSDEVVAVRLIARQSHKKGPRLQFSGVVADRRDFGVRRKAAPREGHAFQQLRKLQAIASIPLGSGHCPG
ncbi:hypothetical protein SDC9_82741 [bioreactor metagenome]|uniref:Uncharacterized protein n=1 Tax=bioreactor metagenome TaxID=1076179 RepID=A0A644Z5K9_9ZZZZ